MEAESSPKCWYLFLFTGFRSISHAYLRHKNNKFAEAKYFAFIRVSAISLLLTWYREFCFPEFELQGLKLTSHLPSSAAVKNEWKYSSTYPISLCLHGVYTDAIHLTRGMDSYYLKLILQSDALFFSSSWLVFA
jgi:hypothetical protein